MKKRSFGNFFNSLIFLNIYRKYLNKYVKQKILVSRIRIFFTVRFHYSATWMVLVLTTKLIFEFIKNNYFDVMYNNSTLKLLHY